MNGRPCWNREMKARLIVGFSLLLGLPTPSSPRPLHSLSYLPTKYCCVFVIYLLSRSGTSSDGATLRNLIYNHLELVEFLVDNIFNSIFQFVHTLFIPQDTVFCLRRRVSNLLSDTRTHPPGLPNWRSRSTITLNPTTRSDLTNCHWSC